MRCCDCGKTFVHEEDKPLGDMRLSDRQAELILNMLVEGSSIRSITRLTGSSIRTILKLMNLVGGRCQRLHGTRVPQLARRRRTGR